MVKRLKKIICGAQTILAVKGMMMLMMMTTTTMMMMMMMMTTTTTTMIMMIIMTVTYTNKKPMEHSSVVIRYTCLKGPLAKQHHNSFSHLIDGLIC